MKTRYLIIGNSVSGINCIEGIRQVDRRGKIIVVSDENIHNYSRPLISYYLGGRVREKETSFRERGFYHENGVELLLNTRAEKIDACRRTVTTNKGTIEFKKLLIATGGRPFVPRIEGCESVKKGVFTFTRLSDAVALVRYIRERGMDRGVVLGGGLIGLKCAEGLIERGMKTAIIELADRLLPSTLDSTASGIIEKALKGKGCEVIKKDTVAAVESRKGVMQSILLKSGRRIETGLLVIAIGVNPDIDIITGTGIKHSRGIIVDSHMRTNLQDIYAAGDVAEGMDSLLSGNAVIAIWPVAARQGRIAGINMAGGEEVYTGMFPMNAVDIAGIPVISFGITAPADDAEYEILEKRGEGFYKKIVLRDNVIKGCIFMGRIERSGIFSGIMRDRVDVSSFKKELLSDDFGLLVLPREYRKHMVVGEGIEI